jgi:hypothetical protein
MMPESRNMCRDGVMPESRRVCEGDGVMPESRNMCRDGVMPESRRVCAGTAQCRKGRYGIKAVRRMRRFETGGL